VGAGGGAVGVGAGVHPTIPPIKSRTNTLRYFVCFILASYRNPKVERNDLDLPSGVLFHLQPLLSGLCEETRFFDLGLALFLTKNRVSISLTTTTVVV
jgi:hypothetical protein